MVRMIALGAVLLVATCSFAHVRVPFLKDNGNEVLPLRQPIHWAFECSFPEELKDPVRAGFQYWDDLLPQDLFKEEGCLRINQVTGIVVHISHELYVDDKGKAHKSIWGTAKASKIDTHLLGGIVTFYKPWTDGGDQWTRVSVARHEVGHALGFDHNDREDCLMYPYINTEKYTYEHKYKAACKAEIKRFVEAYAVPRQ